MKMMKVVLPALLMAVPIHVAQAAQSGMWTLGPNLGFTVVSSGGPFGASVTSIGLPSGGGIIFGSIQPGMRVGHVAAGGGYDIYLDTGVNYTNGDGSSFYTVLSTLNVQFNFSPTAGTTPYATAGGGISVVGGSGSSTENNAMFGLGVGVRHRISDGHGGLRGELRYDRLVASGGADDLNSFGLKLGVDLWIP